MTIKDLELCELMLFISAGHSLSMAINFSEIANKPLKGIELANLSSVMKHLKAPDMSVYFSDEDTAATLSCEFYKEYSESLESVPELKESIISFSLWMTSDKEASHLKMVSSSILALGEYKYKQYEGLYGNIEYAAFESSIIHKLEMLGVTKKQLLHDILKARSKYRELKHSLIEQT